MERSPSKCRRSRTMSAISLGALNFSGAVGKGAGSKRKVSAPSEGNVEQAISIRDSANQVPEEADCNPKAIKRKKCDAEIDAHGDGSRPSRAARQAKRIDLGRPPECSETGSGHESEQSVTFRRSPRKRSDTACVAIPAAGKEMKACAVDSAMSLSEAVVLSEKHEGEVNSMIPSPPSPDSQQDVFPSISACFAQKSVSRPLTPPKVAATTTPSKLHSPQKTPQKSSSDSCLIGDVVWASVLGYPMWPAMLSYDPDSGQFRDSKDRLHVQFFGEKKERAWASSSKIRTFISKDDIVSFKAASTSNKKVRHNSAREKSWKIAVSQAEEALTLDRFTRRERLTYTYQPPLPVRTLSASSAVLSPSSISKTPGEVTPSASVDDPLATKRVSASHVPAHATPVKPKLSVSKTPKRSAKSVSTSSVSEAAPEESAEPAPMLEVVSKAKKQRPISKWMLRVCLVCGDGTDCDTMVHCIDTCGNHFHLNCLGLRVAPVDFRCDECTQGLTSCGVCRDSAGDLKTCASSGCSKQYHLQCLQGFPTTKWLSKARFICPLHMCVTCNGSSGRMDRCARCPVVFHSTLQCLPAGYQRLNETSIVCLRHQSSTTSSIHLLYCYECGHSGTERLNCAHCPQSIEPGCLPADDPFYAQPVASPTAAAAADGVAGAPAQDDSTPPPEPEPVAVAAPQQGQRTPGKSFQTDGPAWVCSDCRSGTSLHFGDIVHCKIGKYRWWPAKIVHEDEIPDNFVNKQPGVGHFVVFFYGSGDYAWTTRRRTIPFDGKHDMPRKGGKFSEHYAAGFEKAKEEWMGRKKTMKPYEHIKANLTSVSAMNAGAYRKGKTPACMCTEENPCSEASGCLNFVANYECDRTTCPVPALCQNRRLQRRKGRQLKIVSEGEKGYGVRCMETIKTGEFVVEYCGEVILEEEFRKRLSAFLDEGEDACFYFMRLSSGVFIDAALKGNAARFINHSCSPNLCTEQWVVQGRPRIGLFACKDIQKGDELSFDYQLDYCGLDRFTKCLCGAANCSGYLGIRPKSDKPVKAPKTEKKKKKPKKPKKRKASEWEDECFECQGESGDLVMCDFPKCPKVYHLDCLKVEKVPHGHWWCPYHVCDECSSKSVEFCSFCSSSCCARHPSVLRAFGESDMVCQRHDEFEILAPRT